MVHLRATGFRIPVRIFPKQLDVELVQSASGANVEGALANLPDRRDAGERQEEAELIGEIGVAASDRLAVDDVLGLEGLAVGRENELGLLFRCGLAVVQSGKRR